MAENVTMFVCDTQEQAEEAAGFLTGLNYAIRVNEATQASFYNAEKYDGGVKEHQYDKWVVVGVK